MRDTVYSNFSKPYCLKGHTGPRLICSRLPLNNSPLYLSILISVHSYLMKLIDLDKPMLPFNIHDWVSKGKQWSTNYNDIPEAL